MTIRRLTVALIIAGLLCVLTWTAALHVTGDHLDCRHGNAGTFCTLRSRNGAGISVQWTGSVTVWRWGPNGDRSRRVWPAE